MVRVEGGERIVSCTLAEANFKFIHSLNSYTIFIITTIRDGHRSKEKS